MWRRCPALGGLTDVMTTRHTRFAEGRDGRPLVNLTVTANRGLVADSSAHAAEQAGRHMEPARRRPRSDPMTTSRRPSAGAGVQ